MIKTFLKHWIYELCIDQLFNGFKSNFLNSKRHKHKWIVFSTAIEGAVIMVKCEECGIYGEIFNHTREQWSEAFHAPSHPYRWYDNNKVYEVRVNQDD